LKTELSRQIALAAGCSLCEIKNSAYFDLIFPERWILAWISGFDFFISEERRKRIIGISLKHRIEGQKEGNINA